MATSSKRRKVSREALQHVLHTGGISIQGLEVLLRKISEGCDADIFDATRKESTHNVALQLRKQRTTCSAGDVEQF
jgi:hypothetical protein